MCNAADEVNKLRRAACFRQIDEAQIKAGLSGSALGVYMSGSLMTSILATKH